MAFELEPPEDDGLYIREVRAWSADKHHFLKRYIDIFTTGMKDKGWDGLHYIDLFAGAGIERIEGKGLDWGSPLIAAQAPNKFQQLHLCDLDKKCYVALEQRVDQFTQPNKPQLFNKDANKIVNEVVEVLPKSALSLAFLDPTGLHLHFKTLQVLSTRRVDLIIYFPDHVDAIRNWKDVYAGKPDSNLNQVLGTDQWHSEFQNNPKTQWVEILRNLYQNQISKLGYKHFDYERIYRTDGRPLYLLMFCTKHETGGKFWRKISRKKRGGQQEFDF